MFQTSSPWYKVCVNLRYYLLKSKHLSPISPTMQTRLLARPNQWCGFWCRVSNSAVPLLNTSCSVVDTTWFLCADWLVSIQVAQLRWDLSAQIQHHHYAFMADWNYSTAINLYEGGTGARTIEKTGGLFFTSTWQAPFSDFLTTSLSNYVKLIPTFTDWTTDPLSHPTYRILCLMDSLLY
jgi:hypothetical protein